MSHKMQLRNLSKNSSESTQMASLGESGENSMHSTKINLGSDKENECKETFNDSPQDNVSQNDVDKQIKWKKGKKRKSDDLSDSDFSYKVPKVENERSSRKLRSTLKIDTNSGAFNSSLGSYLPLPMDDPASTLNADLNISSDSDAYSPEKLDQSQKEINDSPSKTLQKPMVLLNRSCIFEEKVSKKIFSENSSSPHIANNMGSHSTSFKNAKTPVAKSPAKINTKETSKSLDSHLALDPCRSKMVDDAFVQPEIDNNSNMLPDVTTDGLSSPSNSFFNKAQNLDLIITISTDEGIHTKKINVNVRRKQWREILSNDKRLQNFKANLMPHLVSKGQSYKNWLIVDMKLQDDPSPADGNNDIHQEFFVPNSDSSMEYSICESVSEAYPGKVDSLCSKYFISKNCRIQGLEEQLKCDPLVNGKESKVFGSPKFSNKQNEIVQQTMSLDGDKIEYCKDSVKNNVGKVKNNDQIAFTNQDIVFDPKNKEPNSKLCDARILQQNFGNAKELYNGDCMLIMDQNNSNKDSVPVDIGEDGCPVSLSPPLKRLKTNIEEIGNDWQGGDLGKEIPTRPLMHQGDIKRISFTSPDRTAFRYQQAGFSGHSTPKKRELDYQFSFINSSTKCIANSPSSVVLKCIPDSSPHNRKSKQNITESPLKLLPTTNSFLHKTDSLTSFEDLMTQPCGSNIPPIDIAGPILPITEPLYFMVKDCEGKNVFMPINNYPSVQIKDHRLNDFATIKTDVLADSKMEILHNKQEPYNEIPSDIKTKNTSFFDTSTDAMVEDDRTQFIDTSLSPSSPISPYKCTIPSNALRQNSSSPLCSFLLSPKMTCLKGLKTAVGQATGKPHKFFSAVKFTKIGFLTGKSYAAKETKAKRSSSNFSVKFTRFGSLKNNGKKNNT